MEFEIMKYEEAKNLIKSNYESTISDGSLLKLSFSGATSRILDEFFVIIDSSEIEKIMIYTQLAIWGIKYGELRKDVRTEIINIIELNSLAKYRNQLESIDFEEIKDDLEKVKAQLLT